MSRNHINFDEILEQHLDTMIRLAYKQADALELQELEASVNSPDQGAAPTDTRSAYARFQEKLNAANQSERSTRRKRWLPRAITAAACLVLVVGAVTPIAIANVEAIRSKFLEISYIVQERFTEINLIESKEEAFVVPTGWGGDYYPTYIPDGYELEQVGIFSDALTFKNADGDFLYFYENDADVTMSVDTEDAEVSYATVQGMEVMVIQEDSHITLVFANEYRYFVIEGHENINVMLDVADGVRKIVY